MAELADAHDSKSCVFGREGSTPSRRTIISCVRGGILADALDLGSSVFGRAGSNPAGRTIFDGRLLGAEGSSLWRFDSSLVV